jgi:hypothetical protein
MASAQMKRALRRYRSSRTGGAVMLIVSAIASRAEKLAAKRGTLAVVIACGFLVVPASATAATATASVKLSQTFVGVGDAALGKVNVHTKFSSVDRVCFTFTFEGDLLDPGETLLISPLNAVSSVSGPGFSNRGTSSEAERTLCLEAAFQPDLVSLFADGKEHKLEITMQTGSVRIASLDVTVEGTQL